MWFPKIKLQVSLFISNARIVEASLRQSKIFATLLMDLPKAFSCLDYNSFYGKSNDHDFSLPTLTLIQDYLLHKKQRN